MVSSIAPLRYARARDLARGRRGPRRDAAVELRAGAVPAPRVRRRARAARGGAICGRRQPPRASPPTRTRPPRLPPPPPARSSPRSTTPRWWPPWRRSARSRSPRRWRWRCRRTRTRWCWVCAGWRERPRCTCLGTPTPRASVWARPAARAQVREPLLRRAGAGGAPEPHPRRGLDPRALGTRRGVRVRRAARRPIAIRRHAETQGRNSNAMLTSEDDATPPTTPTLVQNHDRNRERSWRARIRWARVKPPCVRPRRGSRTSRRRPRRGSPRTPSARFPEVWRTHSPSARR